MYYQKVKINEDENTFNDYVRSLGDFDDYDFLQLKKRHSISITIGSKSSTNASIGTSGVDVKSGFTGSINYGYWFEDEWMLNLKAGILGSGAVVTLNNISANVVTILQAGVSYYPSVLSAGSTGKSYVGFSIGKYNASISGITNFINIENESESVFGFQGLAGFDFFINDWLKIGPQISYHAVNNFETINSSMQNLSGFEYALIVGIVI
jgi:hypothetical protein